MFEILLIAQIIISLAIFLNFPLNFYYFKSIYQNYNLSYADSLLLNSLIVLNLFLTLSFFKVNFYYLFIIILIISLTFILMRFINFVNLLKRNIYISVIFLIIVFSMSTVIAKTGFLEWDGLGHWIFKAQVYYKGGGV